MWSPAFRFFPKMAKRQKMQSIPLARKSTGKKFELNIVDLASVRLAGAVRHRRFGVHSVPTEQTLREQFFYVAVARFVFLHPKHGVVSVRDPIRLADAEQLGLSPLLIYGLSVAGLPLRWMTFSTVAEPRPILAVLQEAWTQAQGLRGLPDTLRINRHLATACPDLALSLTKIGVNLRITDTADKTHPAALRSAQDAARGLRGESTNKDPVLTLIEIAAQDHRYDSQGGAFSTAPAKARLQIEQWLSLPVQENRLLPVDGMDWTPGQWLYPQEASIPPKQPRYFYPDGLGGRVWLLTGHGRDVYQTEVDDDPIDNCLEEVSALARNLVECWPNPPVEIAAKVGITLRQLQWFLSGRADLASRPRHRLEELLGIGLDRRTNYLTAFGPYVLIARKFRALEAVYTEISNGGDANPWELIPSTGAADPSWRYVLINTYGSPPSFVMVPRGDRIADRLDDLIVNFAGPLSVARAFYQDVVTTCSRACLSPDANISSITEFAQRHERHWTDRVWQPE